MSSCLFNRSHSLLFLRRSTQTAAVDSTSTHLVRSFKWPLHYAALLLLACATVILFLREPGFGDDLTYWSLAFNLHDMGRVAWSTHSHHDLRWPVWGLIWLWQGVFGPGLSSFYFVPMFYLAAGSALAFTFGRLVLGSIGAAWTCGIALLFLPLLDPVISRPMPDLSESVLGACAILAWWSMMKATTARQAVLFGVLSGLSIGISFSNRVTGIFIAPVLAVATLAFYARSWKWLFVPAIAAALYVVAEGGVYYLVCGDWLQCIHGNLGASGATDTHITPLWQLPVRYLSAFFHADRLAPVYTILAFAGIWSAWQRWSTGGRLIVVWFLGLYLEYSCAVQSLHPLRPLMGSTVRYLGALAIPMALLTAIGAIECLRALFLAAKPIRPLFARAFDRPVVCGAMAFVALSLYSSRPFFDLGFVTEMRARLATTPDQTKIFTHRAMRDVAFLADARDAQRFQWYAPKSIMIKDVELEKEAAAADEFWYLRKQLWMRERKNMERKGSEAQPPLGSYLENPEHDWILSDVMAKGTDCDLVFYRQRLAGSPSPRIFTAQSLEFRSLIPTLPTEWNSELDKKTLSARWEVPAVLRGKLVSLEFTASSETVEPLTVKVQFLAGRQRISELLLKPILYAGSGKEFLIVPIPKDADRCTAELRFSPKTRRVYLSGFQAVCDEVR